MLFRNFHFDIRDAQSIHPRTYIATAFSPYRSVPFELYGPQYPGGKIFNPMAFVPAPAGQQGDLGRNVLRGFGAWQADLGLQRQFQLSERTVISFRGELSTWVYGHEISDLAAGLVTLKELAVRRAAKENSRGRRAV
jgi:hypothetical protein